MQCACAILSSVACPALQYFSTLSHKRHDFRFKKLLNVKCVFWFSLQCVPEIFLILRTEWDTVKMYIGLHVQYPLLLSDLTKLELSRQIFEKYPNIKFHKNLSSSSRVVPCGRTEGLIDMNKLIVAFRNFATQPKNSTIISRPLSQLHFASRFPRIQGRLTDWQ